MNKNNFNNLLYYTDCVKSLRDRHLMKKKKCVQKSRILKFEKQTIPFEKKYGTTFKWHSIHNYSSSHLILHHYFKGAKTILHMLKNESIRRIITFFVELTWNGYARKKGNCLCALRTCNLTVKNTASKKKTELPYALHESTHSTLCNAQQIGQLCKWYTIFLGFFVVATVLWVLFRSMFGQCFKYAY